MYIPLTQNKRKASSPCCPMLKKNTSFKWFTEKRLRTINEKEKKEKQNEILIEEESCVERYLCIALQVVHLWRENLDLRFKWLSFIIWAEREYGYAILIHTSFVQIAVAKGKMCFKKKNCSKSVRKSDNLVVTAFCVDCIQPNGIPFLKKTKN